MTKMWNSRYVNTVQLVVVVVTLVISTGFLGGQKKKRPSRKMQMFSGNLIKFSSRIRISKLNEG